MSVGLISFIIFDVVALSICIIWILRLVRQRRIASARNPAEDPLGQSTAVMQAEVSESEADLGTDDLMVELQPEEQDVTDVLKEERHLLAGVLSGLEQKAHLVADLKTSIKSHLSSLGTLLPISGKADEAKIDEEKIDFLMRQTQHSNQLISQLKSDFDNSQQQLKKLSGKLAEKGPDVKKVRQLLDRHKRLKAHNAQLQQQLVKLQAGSEAQQLLIEELQAKKPHETTLEATTNSQNDDFLPRPPDLVIQQDEFDELKTSLARTVKEKEFIERHYLELVESLPEAEEIKQELERTRKELAMLEQHIVSEDDEGRAAQA